MKELEEIIRAYDKAANQNTKTALITVVHVEGSSYRRAGARMLFTEDGRLTGAIGSSYLEGDALQKARQAIETQKSILANYDTTGGENSPIEIGMGCNGIVDILIEPVNHQNPDNPIQLLKMFLKRREDAVLVTLFSMKNKTDEHSGTCLLVLNNNELKGSLTDDTLKEQLINDASEVLKNKTSITRTYRSEDELIGFVELLRPSISLIVSGAGNDAIPMMYMAAVMGWKITIIDERASYANTVRFPLADKLVISKPEDILKHITPDDRTVAILMTHSYQNDLAMLRQLIPYQLPFIGLLGTRRKSDRMLNVLQHEGTQSLNGRLKHIYSPAGLDIGAESPEEIALSICAEIQAVLTNKPGTHLREKKEPIHTRESKLIAH